MRLRFAEEQVQNVPEQSGIFYLWDERYLVYVGRTAPRTGLREELMHALAAAMADDMSVTHFTYEETRVPKTRAAEELRRHFEQWGSLPRYNGASGDGDIRRERREEVRR